MENVLSKFGSAITAALDPVPFAFASGLNFASMGGASHYLENRALFTPRTLKTETLKGIASGAFGGLTSSLAQVAISDEKQGAG